MVFFKGTKMFAQDKELVLVLISVSVIPGMVVRDANTLNVMESYQIHRPFVMDMENVLQLKIVNVLKNTQEDFAKQRNW